MQFYRADALITSAAADIIHDAAILVEDSIIVAVGPEDLLRQNLTVDDEIVDLGHVTLLPGLIDSHVHLGFDGGRQPEIQMRSETDNEQLIRMLHNARALLSCGVTTARDLGARSFLDIAVRDAIATGTAEGPRLITAARPLTPTGGHCWYMGGECDTPSELRKMVRLHHKAGADFIKIMATGGFMTKGSTPWHTPYSLAELEIVVKEAHSLGRRVAAHAHGAEGISRSVAAGVDTIEHCSFPGQDRKFGSKFDPVLADKIVESGIFVCPTVNVHTITQQETFAELLQTVVVGLYDRGAQIIAGTDAGIPNCPHNAYVDGLDALCRAGLPVPEVLDAATLRAARALGVEDRTGSIEPGKEADIIAVRGDPTRDADSLRHLELVIARGRPFLPAQSYLSAATSMRRALPALPS